MTQRARMEHEDVQPAPHRGASSRIRKALGLMGVAMAAPFFVWLPLGLLGIVPSMVDVFGEAGLRTPASVTVGGLLIAALGFHEL